MNDKFIKRSFLNHEYDKMCRETAHANCPRCGKALETHRNMSLVDKQLLGHVSDEFISFIDPNDHNLILA